ncbi:hypothetical protein MAQ5080_02198 [Marinomonas aquimarina]|uniref:Cytochrome b561 bacterial/Ni-hydrogenase domain-containing protein n=1 Tax=Marinomonas aquimarina TaxID=295068 RepID=A0A1A8THR0_9GAMM|nr:cytochrome b/b6 domain-containing protein [Marinomonas aquimarina]SBS32234.1 hypothetical protein MAQ5080_02198 [Marinomonas aquimarina]
MQKVLVWDWPIRLLHWTMVLLFSGLIITGKGDGDNMDWHFYMGYGLSAVVLARVLYGFIGSDFAKFKQFLYHPVEILQHSKALLIGQGKAYLGHNPVGGVMVLVLLLALSVQWGTGLFISDEIFWFGPFYGMISDDLSSSFASLHHSLPNILLALVALHILAVLYHELRFKERLVAAMLHGKKKHPTDVEKHASTPRIGVLLSLGAAVGWLAWLWSIPV